jgi:hypothetical protein
MPAAAVVVVVLYIYIARRWAMMSGGGEGREPRILANKSRRFVGGSLARSPNPSAFARLNVFFFPDSRCGGQSDWTMADLESSSSSNKEGT